MTLSCSGVSVHCGPVHLHICTAACIKIVTYIHFTFLYTKKFTCPLTHWATIDTSNTYTTYIYLLSLLFIILLLLLHFRNLRLMKPLNLQMNP